MLYSRNLNVAQETAKQIASKRIIRFKSQNALYILIEDIKNPSLKNWSRRKKKMPAYAGSKNYDPIIGYLSVKGILTRKPNKYKVEYHVNKQELKNFLETI